MLVGGFVPFELVVMIAVACQCCRKWYVSSFPLFSQYHHNGYTRLDLINYSSACWPDLTRPEKVRAWTSLNMHSRQKLKPARFRPAIPAANLWAWACFFVLKLRPNSDHLYTILELINYSPTCWRTLPEKVQVWAT